MKRWLILIGFAMLAALNWAALHDILKGEPNVWLEWSIVLASLALVVTMIWKRVTLNAKR